MDETIYTAINGGYMLNGRFVEIEWTKTGYTIVQNELDIPVVLSIGFRKSRELSISKYELAPGKSISLTDGPGIHESFWGSSYFCIDFGAYGMVSIGYNNNEGESIEIPAGWYEDFIQRGSNADDFEIVDVDWRGRNYRLRHDIKVCTYIIDDQLIQYLFSAGQ